VFRLALLDDYQGIATKLADWSRLPAESEVRAFHDHLADEDALVARLQDFDAVLAMRERTPLPRGVLSRLPNLKLIVSTGMRNASIDVAYAQERGIVVCGTGGQRTSTAELTWGLILSVMRNISTEDRSVRGGGWQTTIGPALEGKTLGLLGLGNLGSQVAVVGRAFGMNLIAWSQNLTEQRAGEFGARLVTRDELMSQSDVLSVHLVLSDRTRGLVGARELALMKPTAYLVNTSRGPIVDEAALIDALRNRRIAGAGLDVFDVEPLPAGHPFRSLPNTVITPHIGYVSNEGYARYYGDALEDVLSFLDGKPVRVITAS